MNQADADAKARAPKLETRNLSKRFGAFAAVSDVSLTFEPGRIHAVLGENGAGKSTLMKLLFGLHEPSEGRIFLDDTEVAWSSSLGAIRAGLGMVQQHFTLVEPLSAIDNIVLGAEVVGAAGVLNREQAIAILKERLPSASLEVPWHTPVEDLTVGQKQRVEILKLLFRDSKILFLDEPTAVLAPSEIDDLLDVLRKLKATGRTIVLITHKINEVLSVCDTFAVLRQGKLVSKGEVKGTTADDIVEAMIGRRLESPSQTREPARTELAFDCRNLSETLESRGRPQGISMNVHRGEIVGVAGVEGSGQSHLVEAIMGLRHFEGSLEILGAPLAPLQTSIVRERGTGLVPEDRHSQGLWLDESCHVNMIVGLEDRFLKRHLFQLDRMKAETAEWARAFDVRASNLEVSGGSLSGGNQQKLIFAREVTGRDPKFLICHQPTRGVDLGAIELIHAKLLELRNAGVGILLLSSELDELLKLCDRMYVFFEGKVSGEFERSKFDRFAIGRAMTGANDEK